METTRLVALKLVTVKSLLVKDPHTPAVFKLNFAEPLLDAQLSLLALATPWKPTIIEARIEEWDDEVLAFKASIETIESPPKIQLQKQARTLKWGQVKRKRGFVSHD